MRPLRPILRQLLRSPFRIAVIDDQRSWKAIELYVGALHLAKLIERTTDRPHIGLMLPTSGLFPMAAIATWMLGRTMVPLNYLLKPEELAYVIEDAELDAVVTVKPMLEHFGDLPDGVTALKLDEQSFGKIPPLRRAARRDDDHLAVLLYTSGTSGKPKGVMLTAGNIGVNVQQSIEWVHFTSEDRVLGVLPQFHSFGLTVLTLVPLTAGCLVVYSARFMPKRILKLVKKHRPTVFIGIPSMYNAMLTAKSAKKEDFESLRLAVSGGEPLPEVVSETMFERLGVRITEGYGLTETAPVTNVCRPEDYRHKSVGMAIPQVVEKIVGPDGSEVPQGAEGEILIKGPNVMKGYYKLPEETARVFTDDGFFRTGDMGRFDEDGHLYITGRIKEMLIIGGENVFPREIEEVLNKHEAVRECAVIGLADPSRGEVALAFVELEDGVEFDETALRSWCRQSLAQYKVPREIRRVDALPRNATGKIMRRELQA